MRHAKRGKRSPDFMSRTLQGSRKKRVSWMTPYLKMSKAQLIAILDPDMDIEGTIRLSKLSKQKLAHQIRRAIRASEAVARRPCRWGHKPGDPACDLTCFITMVGPLDAPTLEMASVAAVTRPYKPYQDLGSDVEVPLVRAPGTVHSWAADSLSPEVQTRALDDAKYEQERTSLLIPRVELVAVEPLPAQPSYECVKDRVKLILAHEADGNRAIDHLAKMYRDLYAQFDVPTVKHKWWDRIPYSWGWWWRVPYGWWLAFVKWMNEPSTDTGRRLG